MNSICRKLAATCLAVGVGALSAAEPRMVGEWAVVEDEDPFTDEQRSMAVRKDESGRISLMFTCNRGERMVLLMVPMRQYADTRVPVTYRFDKGKVFTAELLAIDEKNFLVVPSDLVLVWSGFAKSAHELNVRIESGNNRGTYTFDLKSSSAAISQLSCFPGKL